MAAETILIVDDEEGVRALLERVCQRAGYLVSTAGSVRGALDTLEDSSFDLLVLDIRLPDGSGIDIMREAKRTSEDLEVIILTGYGNLTTAVEALRLGAYDYVQKPVPDLQWMLNTIARALERRRLARSNRQLVHDLREANEEVQLRRRRQLQAMRYLGQALSAALCAEDIADLLVRALVGFTGCDGAGVYLLRRDGLEGAWALVMGRSSLGLDSREALVAAMQEHLAQLPLTTGREEHMATLQMPSYQQAVTVVAPAGLESEAVDAEPWQKLVYGSLVIRGTIEGVVALAWHGEAPLAEEDSEVFDILVAQGSVALANALLFTRARELATKDSLTEIANRRHFFELLEAEISRAERHRLEMAVIMLDLDKGNGMGLKAVNDAYGHQAGDELLRAITRLLLRSRGRADVVARYGGDEFIVLAPQTGVQDAAVLANRLCEQVRSEPLAIAGRTVRVTVSIGASVFRPGCGRNADLLVGMADRGLYLAKKGGGDQVCLVED